MQKSFANRDGLCSSYDFDVNVNLSKNKHNTLGKLINSSFFWPFLIKNMKRHYEIYLQKIDFRAFSSDSPIIADRP